MAEYIDTIACVVLFDVGYVFPFSFLFFFFFFSIFLAGRFQGRGHGADDVLYQLLRSLRSGIRLLCRRGRIFGLIAYRIRSTSSLIAGGA